MSTNFSKDHQYKNLSEVLFYLRAHGHAGRSQDMSKLIDAFLQKFDVKAQKVQIPAGSQIPLTQQKPVI